MVYIGNDIISLKDKKNLQDFFNPRYLKKILTEEEFVFVKKNKKYHFLSFLFWTCKESAYKILVKKGLRKSFSPKKFNVNININNKCKNNVIIYGHVIYENCKIYTSSLTNNSYIHTIAANYKNSVSKIFCGIKKIKSSDINKQSFYTRNYLIEYLARKFKIDNSNIKILKDDFTGIPFISINELKSDIEISLSHDKEFVSYAILYKKIIFF
jgi:phosphopantetheinyl transferase (holo-ACP synthase)